MSNSRLMTMLALAVGATATTVLLLGACSPARSQGKDAGGTAARASDAEAAPPADDESPPFKRALPGHYFECRADSECAIVQGWCATFAINKAYVEAYDKIPADPKGKALGQCPPGWLPPKPRPVCARSQCSIVSSP